MRSINRPRGHKIGDWKFLNCRIARTDDDDNDDVLTLLITHFRDIEPRGHKNEG